MLREVCAKKHGVSDKVIHRQIPKKTTLLHLVEDAESHNSGEIIALARCNAKPWGCSSMVEQRSPKL